MQLSLSLRKTLVFPALTGLIHSEQKLQLLVAKSQ